MTALLDKVFDYTLKPIILGTHRWYTSHFTGTDLKAKEVFLIIVAKHDHNSALGIHTPAELRGLHSSKNIHIIYKEVESSDELLQVISEVAEKNKIKGLMITAHGSPCGFTLGDDPCGQGAIMHREWILQNKQKIRKGLDKLEKDAVIILHSCETGKVRDGLRPCIAQTISEVANGRFVIAPTTSVCAFDFSINLKNNKAEVEFTTPKTSERGDLLGSIQNIFYQVVYIFGFCRQSCMAKFRACTRAA